MQLEREAVNFNSSLAAKTNGRRRPQTKYCRVHLVRIKNSGKCGWWDQITSVLGVCHFYVYLLFILC